MVANAVQLPVARETHFPVVGAGDCGLRPTYALWLGGFSLAWNALGPEMGDGHLPSCEKVAVTFVETLTTVPVGNPIPGSPGTTVSGGNCLRLCERWILEANEHAAG